jgi:hypothetical protein
MLLDEYAGKPARRLIQIDGHQAGAGDDVMMPDDDGHELMAGATYELRNVAGTPSLPVRVELCEDATKDEVVTLLRKIAEWVESDWQHLSNMGRKAEQLAALFSKEAPH